MPKHLVESKKCTIFVPSFRFVVSGMGAETFCIFKFLFFPLLSCRHFSTRARVGITGIKEKREREKKENNNACLA
ncbi:MAG: hypothetical protein IKO26_07770 [Paludibacteraceae bacterium]|nr:hypothetical protein [Paludibacteraceae bacterium]